MLRKFLRAHPEQRHQLRYNAVATLMGNLMTRGWESVSTGSAWLGLKAAKTSAATDNQRQVTRGNVTLLSPKRDPQTINSFRCYIYARPVQLLGDESSPRSRIH